MIEKKEKTEREININIIPENIQITGLMREVDLDIQHFKLRERTDGGKTIRCDFNNDQMEILFQIINNP